MYRCGARRAAIEIGSAIVPPDGNKLGNKTFLLRVTVEMPNHQPDMSQALTRKQLRSRKDKAVRFVQDVLDDPDRAEEIEDESLHRYAERCKIELQNP